MCPRIATIQSLPNDWYWINSKDNVADEASKLHGKITIKSDSRWLKGPSFLLKISDEWPKSTIQNKSTDMNPSELKSNFSVNIIIRNDIVLDVQRFCTFWRMKRIMAWVLRSKLLFMKRRNKESFPATLTYEELKSSENYLCKMPQRESFPEEINCISRNEVINFKVQHN